MILQRGITIAQQFNKKLTTNEEGFQNLIQVAELHRKNFPIK